jgi:N-acetylglutamate synthase-like GNAT family acetyltransferase
MIEGYQFSSRYEDMDLNLIHSFISRTYWASGIPQDTLTKALVNSICFGAFKDSGEQVAFARVITDKATFAYLADVFVLEEHRGKGLSKCLMHTVIHHPDLQNLRRMVLATRDAHGLYEQFGFKSLSNPQTFMEIWKPDVYIKV